MTVPKGVYGIIPAAGQSRRMGTSKLALPWRATTLGHYVLQQWCRSAVSHVVVTVRKEDPAAWQALRGTRAEPVIVDPPPPDMKASVLHALRYLTHRYAPTADSWWLLAPADMPFLSCRLINALLQQLPQADTPVVVPRYRGKCGHPVALRWSLAAAIEEIPSGSGINVLLSHTPAMFWDVEDWGAVLDVDTPEQWDALHAARPSPGAS